MKKIILIILGLLIIAVPFITSSNDEDLPMKCYLEIPSGEALTLTHDLLTALIEEVEAIQRIAREMIPVQNKMNELSATSPDGKFCHIRHCQAVCSCICSPNGPCVCVRFPCLLDPCPYKAEIQALYNQIRSMEQEIQVRRQNVDDLINKEQVKLCIKENIDIRQKGDCPLLNKKLVTYIEQIRRKLNFSREYINEQHPVVDHENITDPRDLAGMTMLRTCQDVMNMAHEIEVNTKKTEKVGGEEVPVCTDPHNWFSCGSFHEETFIEEKE